jgi:hypothetical protein
MTRVAADVPIGRVPSRRNYNIPLYVAVVKQAQGLIARLLAVRDRYKSVMPTLREMPTEQRAKVIALGVERTKVDTTTVNELRPILLVLTRELDAAIAEGKGPQLTGVSADVVAAFDGVAPLVDRLDTEVSALEAKANDALAVPAVPTSGIPASAAEATEGEELSIQKLAPKSWTADDLELVQKFHDQERRVSHWRSSIDRFYAEVHKESRRSWSVALSNEVSSLYGLFDSGEVRELLAELGGPSEAVERNVSEHTVRTLGKPTRSVLDMQERSGLGVLVEEALRKNFLASTKMGVPLADQTKTIIQAYLDRTATLSSVAREADALVRKMQQESRPTSEWAPSELAFYRARQRYEEARTKKIRGQIPEEEFARITEEFEKARAEHEQYGGVERHMTTAALLDRLDDFVERT